MSAEDGYRFKKTRACPTSEELLSLNLAELPVESISKIFSHLKVCDFCAAEAHFFSSVQVTAVPNPPAEIPPHLRLLAESLLRKRASTS
ncbi:MAG TPA: hypothetical protein VI306_21810 [Pyrinomonadaceae bacterium]